MASDQSDFSDKPVSPGSFSDPRTRGGDRPAADANPPARVTFPGGAGNVKPADETKPEESKP